MKKDINSKLNDRNIHRNIQINDNLLAKTNDEELKRLYLEIRATVNRGKRQKLDVRQSEVDLCYVQREIQLRKLYKKV